MQLVCKSIFELNLEMIYSRIIGRQHSERVSEMETLKEWIPLDNQVFSGGMGLAVIAGSAQVFRASYRTGMQMLRRHFLVTLEVTSKDKSFPWVLNWLSVQSGARTQHLSVETVAHASNAKSLQPIGFRLVHGPGQHIIKYEGHYILVSRSREQQMVDLNSGKPWEKVVFTSIGRNVDVYHRLLQDAYQLTAQQEEGKTIIYTNWGTEWRPFGHPRVKRTLDSVVLDDGLSHKLYEDVTTWIASSNWYRDRGIPYRRGYLLHGPPGSGKSSFIYALAGALDYNICLLNLNERGLTDDRLALALSHVPPQSIVLLEDIDAVFPATHGSAAASRQSSHHSDVTFSGLLNVLDGVAASEDRLVFMTTNHLQRLDPALIRPGRVDVCQLVGDASDHQIRTLFERFYAMSSRESSRDCDDFLTALRRACPQGISMAALQGHLLLHKESAQAAIASVHTLPFGLSAGQHSASQAAHHNHAKHSEGRPVVQPRPVRRISATEVDKMVFNPQSDWDKDVK